MLKGKKVLILVAMREEFSLPETAPANHRVIYTNVGKINAAMRAERAMDAFHPNLVLNVGTAGSAEFPYGEIVNCTRFVQRDMDLSALGYPKYATPDDEISSEPVLGNGVRLDGFPEGVCGTGDSFDTSSGSHGYGLVDMEAYALAKVCAWNDAPFLCMKYISDGADGNAPAQFRSVLEQARGKLGALYEKLLDL